MLNVLSSLICSVGGAGVEVVNVLVVAIDGTMVPSRYRRSNHFSPILCCIEESGTFCVHPSRAYVALVAHFSTCDVASTYGTGVLCRSALVRMYIARHL